MNFYLASQKYLEDKGYKYLGEDGGLVFFNDENGKLWGASEDVIAKNMIKKGYWG